jgi:rRNA maturation protein Rpf1
MFLPFVSFSQIQDKLGLPISEITVKDLDLVSFDNKDQIFASNITGDIYQYNSAGKQLNLYSPARQGRLQQLEAAWTVNIFSFSADLQEYRILDRFMNLLSEMGFLLADINLAKAATLGNNNIIWIWDESDLSLKTLDYLRNLITQSQPLNLILNSDNLEVLEIREFKNRLFMNVASEGIFIFDNQGNFLKKIKIVTNQRMSFYNEHLLWIQENHVMAFSIATQAIFKIAEIPTIDYQYMQVGKETLALVEKDKINVYPLPNWIKTLR